MDYNQHNIDRLLERYWAGETSMDEERLLKQYFRFGNVDEKHKAFSDIFTLADERDRTVSESFDTALLDKITETKVVTMRPRRYLWMGVAAACVIALFATVAIQLMKLDEQQLVEEETKTQFELALESDPEALKAWNETRAALVGLSNRMNKGQEKTLHFSKFNQATMAVKGESK